MDRTRGRPTGNPLAGRETVKSNACTIIFGRFNPPTTGHEKVINKGAAIAGKDGLIIYPSRSIDKKNNPLDVNTKIKFMRTIFHQYRDCIIDDPGIRTIMDALTVINQKNCLAVNIVVGSDRHDEFESKALKYNGVLYNFDIIRVVDAGIRDPLAGDITGMSASKMRKAAENNDFASFRSGTPSSASDDYTRIIFDAVRKGMGLEEPN